MAGPMVRWRGNWRWSVQLFDNIWGTRAAGQWSSAASRNIGSVPHCGGFFHHFDLSDFQLVSHGGHSRLVFGFFLSYRLQRLMQRILKWGYRTEFSAFSLPDIQPNECGVRLMLASMCYRRGVFVNEPADIPKLAVGGQTSLHQRQVSGTVYGCC